MRRYILVGAAALALVGAALAQVGLFGGPIGSEAILAQQGGPGGSSFFITSGRLSSGRSTALFAAFPTASFTIGGANPTGTTVSTVGVANGGDLLFNVTNGTAITITMPATSAVLDGEIIGICNVTTSAWATNAVTVAANTGQSITTAAGNSTTLTTLAAITCNKWLWNLSTTTWFAVIGG